jgi:DNA-directed RNA polymerase subunit M/transcription elongation factor TFIIS
MKCACCGSEMLPHEEIGKAIVFKCKECGLSNSIPNETLDQ